MFYSDLRSRWNCCGGISRYSSGTVKSVIFNKNNNHVAEHLDLGYCIEPFLLHDVANKNMKIHNMSFRFNVGREDYLCPG